MTDPHIPGFFGEQSKPAKIPASLRPLESIPLVHRELKRLTTACERIACSLERIEKMIGEERSKP